MRIRRISTYEVVYGVKKTGIRVKLVLFKIADLLGLWFRVPWRG